MGRGAGGEPGDRCSGGRERETRLILLSHSTGSLAVCIIKQPTSAWHLHRAALEELEFSTRASPSGLCPAALGQDLPDAAAPCAEDAMGTRKVAQDPARGLPHSSMMSTIGLFQPKTGILLVSSPPQHPPLPKLEKERWFLCVNTSSPCDKPAPPPSSATVRPICAA